MNSVVTWRWRRQHPACAGDYAWSVLYRAVRLFVIVGTDDRSTAQQFDRSRLVHAAGTCCRRCTWRSRYWRMDWLASRLCRPVADRLDPYIPRRFRSC
jgi:hypothetical protein